MEGSLPLAGAGEGNVTAEILQPGAWHRANAAFLLLQAESQCFKIQELGLLVAHGFFTFLTDEELEADSLRFLCSNRKQKRDVNRGQLFGQKSP